ncbi:MAG: type II secretion system protein N [Gammaproteobacteria bacterium]
MLINKKKILPLLSHPYAKIIGLSITGLCGLWIILNLIQTTAIFFYHAPTHVNTTPSLANSSAESALVAQIPNWHLFGQAPLAPSNEQNLPLSSLNLTVTGIFYQSDHKQAKAIISDANGNTKVYKVGDIVPGGVTLYDILPDSVIVESDGQLEKLTISGRELQFSPPPQGLP